jgi:RNA polymerase sigma-70 factor (ECF subfamily)
VDLDTHLDAIRAGDATAFGRWVAGCEMRVRMSLRRFATQVDIEAVLQETLLRVWQVAPRFTPDGKPDALLRFAVRVARNVAISEMRRMGHDRAALLAAEQAKGDNNAPVEPDPLLRELIARCREQLPRQPALALAERIDSAGSAPDRELAARVGMQANTFLQNVTRARKLLVECLERHDVHLEAVMR